MVPLPRTELAVGVETVRKGEEKIRKKNSNNNSNGNDSHNNKNDDENNDSSKNKQEAQLRERRYLTRRQVRGRQQGLW